MMPALSLSNGLVSLLLAAAPLLEPDPGKLQRIQPRDVSGTKADGALWAVDDDPATAWKAGLKDGAFHWGGVDREKATALKVFVRPGCQGSQASFAAYARPHHVELSPRVFRRWFNKRMLLPTPLEPADVEGEPERKSASVSAELQDVAGWQSIDVPLSGATAGMRSGFVLQVKDTYPGKEHEELCITDLRVYLDSPDPVDSSEEQLALDSIKRSVRDTLTRAPLAPKRLPAKFESSDIDVESPPAQAPKGELALESPNTFPSMVKRARQTAAELRAIWKVPVSQLEANGWKRASVQSVLDDDASFETALLNRETISLMGDGLLAADDFKLVAAQNPLTALRSVTAKMQKLGGKPLECEAVCLATYAASSTSANGSHADCARVCQYGDDMLAGMRADLGGSGIFVKGGLESPREVLLLQSREGGEREVVRRNYRELFVYANGRVSQMASITFDPRYVETHQLAWNEDRSAVQSVMRISLQGSKVEYATQMTAAPEHAAADVDPEAALAFGVQR